VEVDALDVGPVDLVVQEARPPVHHLLARGEAHQRKRLKRSICDHEGERLVRRGHEVASYRLERCRFTPQSHGHLGVVAPVSVKVVSPVCLLPRAGLLRAVDAILLLLEASHIKMDEAYIIRGRLLVYGKAQVFAWALSQAVVLPGAVLGVAVWKGLVAAVLAAHAVEGQEGVWMLREAWLRWRGTQSRTSLGNMVDIHIMLFRRCT